MSEIAGPPYRHRPATAANDALDELTRPHPSNATIASMLGKLSQLGRELGLSPVAEKMLKYDVAQKAAIDRWLRMADSWAETVEPEPAAPADMPAHDAP